MLIIAIALGLLTVLSLKNVNILIVACITALFLALCSGLPLLPTMTNTYMTGVVNFVKGYWLMFLLGSLFGAVMEETGAASAIAQLIVRGLGEKSAAFAVVVASGLLTYGGVASMVIVFAMYPVALALFKKANLTRSLLPAAIGAGAFSFATGMFPGSPQPINVLPTTYLHTTVTAASTVGIVCGVFTLVAFFFYFSYESRRRTALGMSFEMDDFVAGTLDKMTEMEKNGKIPNHWLALIPPTAVVLTLNFVKADFWDIHVSLLCGVLLCGLLFFKNLSNPLAVLNKGANNSIVAIMNTGAVIGIGAVIRATPAFSSLVETVLSLGGNPLIAFGAATSVVAGATASGQGGLGIALAALAEPYLAAGVNPEILHRVGTIACLGLDSLPHNGAIITLLVMTGMDHKKSYMPIFWTTVVITTIALIIAIVMGSMLYPIGAA